MHISSYKKNKRTAPSAAIYGETNRQFEWTKTRTTNGRCPVATASATRNTAVSPVLAHQLTPHVHIPLMSRGSWPPAISPSLRVYRGVRFDLADVSKGSPVEATPALGSDRLRQTVVTHACAYHALWGAGYRRPPPNRGSFPHSAGRLGHIIHESIVDINGRP